MVRYGPHDRDHLISVAGSTDSNNCEGEVTMKAELSHDDPQTSLLFPRGSQMMRGIRGILYQTLDDCLARCQQIPPVLYFKSAPLSLLSTPFITKAASAIVLSKASPYKLSRRLASNVKHKIQIWISSHLRDTIDTDWTSPTGLKREKTSAFNLHLIK